MQVAKAARCRGVTLAMAAMYQCQETHWVYYKDTRSEFWVRLGKTTDKMGKNWKKQTITGKWVASHPPIYKIRALAPLERRRAKQLGGTSFPAPDTAINRQIIVVSHSFINRLELITHHSRQFSSHSNDYRLVTSPWLWMLEGLRIQSWLVGGGVWRMLSSTCLAAPLFDVSIWMKVEHLECPWTVVTNIFNIATLMFAAWLRPVTTNSGLFQHLYEEWRLYYYQLQTPNQ